MTKVSTADSLNATEVSINGFPNASIFNNTSLHLPEANTTGDISDLERFVESHNICALIYRSKNKPNSAVSIVPQLIAFMRRQPKIQAMLVPTVYGSLLLTDNPFRRNDYRQEYQKLPKERQPKHIISICEYDQWLAEQRQEREAKTATTTQNIVNVDIDGFPDAYMDGSRLYLPKATTNNISELAKFIKRRNVSYVAYQGEVSERNNLLQNLFLSLDNIPTLMTVVLPTRNDPILITKSEELQRQFREENQGLPMGKQMKAIKLLSEFRNEWNAAQQAKAAADATEHSEKAASCQQATSPSIEPSLPLEPVALNLDIDWATFSKLEPILKAEYFTQLQKNILIHPLTPHQATNIEQAAQMWEVEGDLQTKLDECHLRYSFICGPEGILTPITMALHRNNVRDLVEVIDSGEFNRSLPNLIKKEVANLICTTDFPNKQSFFMRLSDPLKCNPRILETIRHLADKEAWDHLVETPEVTPDRSSPETGRTSPENNSRPKDKDPQRQSGKRKQTTQENIDQQKRVVPHHQLIEPDTILLPAIQAEENTPVVSAPTAKRPTKRVREETPTEEASAPKHPRKKKAPARKVSASKPPSVEDDARSDSGFSDITAFSEDPRCSYPDENLPPLTDKNPSSCLENSSASKPASNRKPAQPLGPYNQGAPKPRAPYFF